MKFHIDVYYQICTGAKEDPKEEFDVISRDDFETTCSKVLEGINEYNARLRRPGDVETNVVDIYFGTMRGTDGVEIGHIYAYTATYTDVSTPLQVCEVIQRSIRRPETIHDVLDAMA